MSEFNTYTRTSATVTIKANIADASALIHDVECGWAHSLDPAAIERVTVRQVVVTEIVRRRNRELPDAV